MKQKKVYICSNCGHNSPKWEGKCAVCDEWNTYQEEILAKESKTEKKKKAWDSGKSLKQKPVLIQDVQNAVTSRLKLADNELNRTLGGGLVPGSIILIGGDPGIGKSTLLLQLALKSPYNVLYVSGEESAEQIKMRAERIGIQNKSCHVLTETNLNKLLQEAKSMTPDILIIDSIQTISSPHIES